ncbi:hypothetical protein M513_10003 [Trichuris suis]|uniref:Uncharacterized protein n=1 Tax=Trichuris suis TaxID=68888 RepID=A0A085LW33_9BILA|nr:hypothetical protein M513_10003 [Trichuris suis]
MYLNSLVSDEGAEEICRANTGERGISGLWTRVCSEPDQGAATAHAADARSMAMVEGTDDSLPPRFVEEELASSSSCLALVYRVRPVKVFLFDLLWLARACCMPECARRGG